MSTNQRIPAHAGETKTFIPAALSDVEAPPSFVLKAVDRRQREAMEYHLLGDGLQPPRDEDVRDITIDEICRLYACDSDDEKVERVRAYWRAVDDYIDEAKAKALEWAAEFADDEKAVMPQMPPFEHPDAQHVTELLERVNRASPALRRIGVDGIRWNREVGRYYVAHAVARWTGLETQPSYEDGVLLIDSVVDMRDELVSKYGPDKGKLAFAELVGECGDRVYVNKATEKNSSSPAPSAPTPQAMKDNGSDETNGKSPASEPSDETPAA